MKKVFITAGICLLIFQIQVEGQNRFRGQRRLKGPPTKEDTVRLFEMVYEMDSVISYIEQYLQSKENEERLRKLKEQADQLAHRQSTEKLNTSTKFHSGVRQQQGMNPNFSLGGDFFFGASTQDNEFLNEGGDFGYGTNGLMMREIELGIEAALDPFTRGKTFISVANGEINLEEAYIEVLNLPLNMNIKLGIFAPEFGPLNRYHDHALPQFDRPTALVNYFTTGQLKGPGAAANFMLPKLLWANASTLELAVIRSDLETLFTSGRPWNFQYVGHLKNFYEISYNTYIEYSLNSVYGKNNLVNPYHSSVSSLGLGFKWIPGGNAKYRTFDVKSEFFYGLYEMPDQWIKSKGFYCSVQNKLSSRMWISGRVGYSEIPNQPDQNQWDYTVAMDFWQSEFVFFRLQYQYNQRLRWLNQLDIDPIPSDHSLVLQVCWAMGPHRHEAY